MNDTFDLAFSFAGEDRKYVEEVKLECEKLGLTIYYDEDRRIDQWGKSFIGEQRKVYSGYKTKHFVPFISQYYFIKPIPTDEFKAALLESTKRSQYILPIKLDDSKISVEYLHGDTQYLKSSDYTPVQLAGALKYVVGRSKEPAKEVDQLLSDELDLKPPKVVPRAYSKFAEAESLIQFIGSEFKKHLPQLENEGYVPIVRQQDDRTRVMVERESKTLFGLDVFFSTMGGNAIGFNFNTTWRNSGSESLHGSIEPVYDRNLQKAGFILNDFSGFALGKGTCSKEDIVKYFWGKMNQTLESKF